MASNPRHTNTWHCSNGAHLEVIAAWPKLPDLMAHWWPLYLAARSATEAQLRWPIALEDFRLVGEHLRQSRPGVWVYVHIRTGAELFIDNDGQTYRFKALRSDPTRGRFTTCDIQTAAVAAGLQDARSRPPSNGPDVSMPRTEGGVSPAVPRHLIPGSRREARRRARAAQGLTFVDLGSGNGSNSTPTGPPIWPKQPTSFAKVLPGPPRSWDFAERWEPRLMSDDPALQASLDHLEAALLRDQARPTGGGGEPARTAESSAPPSAGRPPSPQPTSRPRPRPYRRAPAGPGSVDDRSRPVPYLRQVWPPRTRPRHW